MGQRHAAPPDADNAQILRTVILFNDFVGQPDDGPLNFGAGHQLRLFFY
jgi:hypothetical protein